MRDKIGTRRPGFCRGCGDKLLRKDGTHCGDCEAQSVPADIFLSIIDQYRHVYIDDSVEPDAWLSIRLGKGKNYIGDIRKRDYGVNFLRVDEVLCNMGLQHLWWEPPLDEYYWMGEIPPDRSKPVKCACPGCPNWFSLQFHEAGGQIRNNLYAIYCRARCKSNASEIRLGKRRIPGSARMIPCGACGEIFEPKRFASRGTRQKYCGPDCVRAAKNAGELARYYKKKEANAV